MKKTLFTFLALSTPFVLADDKTQQIQEQLDNQRMQQNRYMEPAEHRVKPLNVKAKNQGKRVSITPQELSRQPQLLNSAMLTALVMNHTDNVVFLRPIYQQLPANEQNEQILLWAEAIQQKSERNYSDSIRLYRTLIAQNPQSQPIRFQLAAALFENRETEAAEEQFRKLQTEQLPAEIAHIIEQYLNAINKQDKWNFQGGLTYLNDPNINNAPDSGITYKGWTPPKKESAQGIGFNFDADKKWSWGNGFFHQFRLNGSGKYYWNNKKYNEYSLRESLGLGYQNAKHRIMFLPFLEQMWYSGGSSQSTSTKRYSKAGGINTRWHYWLTPQWQSVLNYEYAEQRYTRRKHLNGNYHFVAPSLYYYPNSQQYWFVGANFNRTSTRDLDDSFIRRGLTLGWGQEWKNGLSSQLSVSYALKQYRGPNFFNITQKNKEYGIQASLWHRAVHFWGITPRLTWSYTKIKSNHPFNNYDKNRIYLDFSHTF
ncbi:hypothetical protein A4G16_09470 [Mannheimia granulomatis]|uniref:Outer membrane protein n=1 Tax=Mannheimia granulomatis TaxID=85402 RepID=A0A6G8JK77_9PAST|nr:surface lipoprotein assembly modifier [Mannheimia granulomatis]QIM67570.1 hypothetical protein A4G16_09470 [Mannheimia granulomatis]